MAVPSSILSLRLVLVSGRTSLKSRAPLDQALNRVRILKADLGPEARELLHGFAVTLGLH
jgi:hypothetical protein